MYMHSWDTIVVDTNIPQLFILDLQIILEGNKCHYSQFTGKETENKRSNMMCLILHIMPEMEIVNKIKHTKKSSVLLLAI